MKKYIIVLLALVSVHALLADDIISPGQESSNHLSTSISESAPSMRLITQDEFDGKVPIVIHLNETVVIPIYYQIYFLSNHPQIFFGPADSPAVSVDIDGFTPSSDSGAVNFNLVCTGTQVGNDTVEFGEGGYVARKFNVQVVE